MKTKAILRMLLFLIVIALASYSIYAGATPEGPLQYNISGGDTRSAAGPISHGASGGNVTMLNLSGTTVTQTWHGYYGTVSGTITLDDSLNHTIYDWAVANPQGEVYATTSNVINWNSANLACYNFDNTSALDYYTLAEVESDLGVGAQSSDGLNETFKTTTNHNGFFVGVKQVNANSCPAAWLYNGSDQASDDFQQVLLYADDTESIIYTALLTQNKAGFTNQSIDFEMIIGENGHGTNTETTPYYFYIELE